MHNHPSGDPTPSDADLRVTRELIQVGRILRIEVLDHVIMGYSGFVSLRAFGLFQP
jgi:DNA repair protein RadC